MLNRDFKIDIEDIGRSGLVLKRGGFKFRIYFYPSAWKWTHYLEIDRNKYQYIGFPCKEMVLKETLRVILKNNKESKTLWSILKLLNRLSFYTRGERLEAFLKNKDISSILKGVWLSMVLTKYGPVLRSQVRREVRKLVKAGEISKKNRFVKKILAVEKYVLWKKVFSEEWSEVTC